MATLKTLEEIIAPFPEVTIEPHFEKISFRVKKKIFATFDQNNLRVSAKLSEIDQNVFSSIAPGIIYPVNNKWGKQGWTIVEINEIKKELLSDLITTAYCETAPKKLAEIIRPKSQE